MIFLPAIQMKLSSQILVYLISFLASSAIAMSFSPQQDGAIASVSSTNTEEQRNEIYENLDSFAEAASSNESASFAGRPMKHKLNTQEASTCLPSSSDSSNVKKGEFLTEESVKKMKFAMEEYRKSASQLSGKPRGLLFNGTDYAPTSNLLLDISMRAITKFVFMTTFFLITYSWHIATFILGDVCNSWDRVLVFVTQLSAIYVAYTLRRSEALIPYTLLCWLIYLFQSAEKILDFRILLGIVILLSLLLITIFMGYYVSIASIKKRIKIAFSKKSDTRSSSLQN